MAFVRLYFAVILLVAGCSPKASSPPRPPVPETSFSFAVLGDNRGVSSAAPVFLEIVDALIKERPSLVVNTGDMINGHQGDTEDQLRGMWQSYQAAIGKVPVSAYAAPGNHDLFDDTSAKLWKEFCGPTYYTFDYQQVQFIVLDSETLPGRLGDEQFIWLKKKLADRRATQVFVFLHRPLFPVDGHIGSSMDMFPDERDQLHRLFVQHGDRIQGVFLGHEHMYYHQEVDGVSYYTTAGGGAELYMPVELGGFYHYLLVHVTPKAARVEVKRILAEPKRASIPRKIEPGQLLESFDHGLLWYSWDHSVVRSLTSDVAKDGRQALKLEFDLDRCEYPVLMGSLEEGWDFDVVDELVVDVFVPDDQGVGLTITPVLEGSESCEAPIVKLQNGWNTVTARLNEAWLVPDVRRRANQLQWNLAAVDKKDRGWVAFDNLRAIDTKDLTPSQPEEIVQKLAGTPRLIRPGTILESWEQHSLWGAWTETTPPSGNDRLKTEGIAGLKLNIDFSKSPRASLYSSPDPMWDLTAVESLLVDVYVPDNLQAEMRIGLVLGQQTDRYAAPKVPLRLGWNHLRIELNTSWLPAEARKSIEVVEWQFTGKSDSTAKGFVIIDNLRSGPK